MPAALGVVGFGSMGSAILRGAIAARVLRPGDVIVVEPDHNRREDASRLGCVTAGEARFVLDAQQILLCVKPQTFSEVARQMGRLMTPKIVISIMAGLSSGVIRQALGSQARVIRMMPNIPCRVGAGITAIARGEGAREGDEALARRIVAAIGEVAEVDESQMDAVTALSGSGPAYVFLLAESMEQAGMQMGLDVHVARALAYHTVLGAGRLLTETNHANAETLRQAVTSPGGTTAAALEEMFERELPQIVVEAIHAARDRGIDLNQAEA